MIQRRSAAVSQGACAGLSGRQKKIPDPIFQVGPQPGIVRHWKSDLFAIQNFLWNPVVENPLENVFRCESMDFLFFREGGRELL
jgi:hypothetical protein